jgi:hypothetical protein
MISAIAVPSFMAKSSRNSPADVEPDLIAHLEQESVHP